MYFKDLSQYHARPRDTSLGSLMVTNLTGFPVSLTIIPVPDGDVMKHRDIFFTNENLKRLGCAGRVAISLAEPSVPAVAKFHQLYKISDKIDARKAVIEMIKLCQVALTLFDILEVDYVDGLLCDVTEKAVAKWWAEFGVDVFNVEPNDGVLGPSSVAGLLGTLIGARNRLHAFGAPVGKDVFEMETTRRAIAHFQKSQRLRRTRKLNQKTLHRLHEITAKQATAESWAVPRAVKSTVAELSGKGGEMVMDMVGGRDKATLAEIETTNIERFAQLVKGDRAKWLWLGRRRKAATGDLFSEHPGNIISPRDAEADIVSREPSAEFSPIDRAETLESDRSPIKQLPYHKRGLSRHGNDAKDKRTALQRATGRLKGAVGGRRDEHHKHERAKFSRDIQSAVSLQSNPSGSLMTPGPSPPNGKATEEDEDQDWYIKQHHSPDRRHYYIHKREHMDTPITADEQTDDGQDATGDRRPQSAPWSECEDEQFEAGRFPSDMGHQTIRSNTADESIEGTFTMTLPTAIDYVAKSCFLEEVSSLFKRASSFAEFEKEKDSTRHEQFWPRHLSFSAAEEALHCSDMEEDLDYDPANKSNFFEAARNRNLEDQAAQVTPGTPTEPVPPNMSRDFEVEVLQSARLHDLQKMLAKLNDEQVPFLSQYLGYIRSLDDLAAQDTERLSQLTEPLDAEHSHLSGHSQEVMKIEKERLEEAMKDVETLQARLEYEIEALRGKVEDVQNAVTEFEGQVGFVEDRVEELWRGARRQSVGSQSNSWFGWMFGWWWLGRRDYGDSKTNSEQMKDGQAISESGPQAG